MDKIRDRLSLREKRGKMLRNVQPNKKIIFYLIFLFSIVILVVQVFFPVVALAEGNGSMANSASSEKNNESGDIEKILDEQIKSRDIKSIEEQLNKYSSKDINEIIPGYDPQKIISDASKGKFSFDVGGILGRIGSFLFKEIYINLNILIKLVVLAVLCSILKNLQTSFLSESVGELAFYVCYIVIVSVLIVSFSTALRLGKEIIDSMVSFVHAAIPVLLTFLMSNGNIISSGIFQPILFTIVEITATLIKGIFIPLIFLATILNIVDNISNKIQISKLASFFKTFAGWATGLILTVFVATVSVQGSLGAVVDGIAGKTAKFALSNFVPVVGKCLSDAADAVVGSTLLIKNAAGVAIMIGVIIICLFPLLKILAILILYKLTCVLIEPVSDKRITNCINDMANSLTFILGISASVAFMFLITITLLVGAGNVSAMIR